MSKRLIAILVLGTLTLAGCGQSGPLYMPDDSQQQNEQQEQ
ncbi:MULTISPECIES: LPS translocon maturation chaperone LptM [Photobacterium]|nr:MULTISPECIES: lipoprotein [Photobacterium]MBV1839919.1 lipoprotein [Photobacterium ganghwense]PSU04991.1 hypothetical protein C9I92_22865 [Photobacterium ganghwense]QSV14028.1 lipoprotein [Photobacterium ganghwense]